ncbi:unnamed protein product [Ostreobium quekettii]|uniref:Importin subunit alpha n=1 Tax=Ostreobium quekettii TaxID=121088 RepID=A0A8S1IN49_9CHLO|nr:unnamed protein product [Ostreobium quekettii]|eukprot:evm.model.scf_2793.1 EVM.evm.TU.scf_2793.1   scf_2793:13122-14702(+)
MSSKRKPAMGRAGITGKEAKEQSRRRAVDLSTQRRDALLRSKRLRRVFEDGDGNGDGLFTSLDPLALQTAVNQAVRQAASSQASQDGRLAGDLRYLRKLLSEGEESASGAVLEAGAVPVLVSALQPGPTGPHAVEASLEAGWALAYLAGGSHAVASAVLPASPALIAHLSCGMGAPLAEVSAWAIGNLAADCSEFSDTLVANGAVRALAELMFSVGRGVGAHETVVAAITASWALANLVRFSSVAAKQLLAAPQAPTRLLEMLSLDHPKIVTEVAWLLTYLLSRDPGQIEPVLASGVVAPLIRLLSSSVGKLEADLDGSRATLTPVLRCLGNIAAGPDLQAARDLVSAEGGVGVRCMVECLNSSHRGLQKEAAWALSNIAGSPDKMGPSAVKNSGAVPVLLDMTRRCAFDVKKEVAFTLANVCVGSEKEEPDVEFLQSVISTEHNLLETFLSFMKSPDMEAARLGIRFVEVVLRVVPNGPKLVESADGIFALEELQFKGPEDLQRLAADLVDKYYGEDYGLEDDAM